MRMWINCDTIPIYSVIYGVISADNYYFCIRWNITCLVSFRWSGGCDNSRAQQKKGPNSRKNEMAFVEKGLDGMVNAAFILTKYNWSIQIYVQYSFCWCCIISIPLNDINYTNICSHTRNHTFSLLHSLFRLHTEFHRKAYWFYQHWFDCDGFWVEFSSSLPPVALALSFHFLSWNNNFFLSNWLH